MAGTRGSNQARRYADLPLGRALDFHAVEETSPFAYATSCARYRFAASLLAGGERVLDVGCGPGFGCPILKRADAASVVGLEEQAEMAAYAAKRHGGPGIEFVTGSGLEHGFAPASFDIITSFEVIEHLERPERLLNRCASWLRPGGRLVISTPNRIVHELMGIVWEFHVREYGYRELVELCEQVFDRNSLEFYGQNPKFLEQFRLRRGRFAPARSPIPRAIRPLIPRALISAVRRVVPRRPAPVSPSDPDLLDACRIEGHDIDACETFVVVARAPR